jgi:hypothetical protein
VAMQTMNYVWTLFIFLIPFSSDLHAQNKSYFDKYEKAKHHLRKETVAKAKQWLSYCGDSIDISKIGRFGKVRTGYGSDTYDILKSLDRHAKSMTLVDIEAQIKLVEKSSIYFLVFNCWIQKGNLGKYVLIFDFDANANLLWVSVTNNNPRLICPYSQLYDANCNKVP